MQTDLRLNTTAQPNSSLLTWASGIANQAKECGNENRFSATLLLASFMATLFQNMATSDATTSKELFDRTTTASTERAIDTLLKKAPPERTTLNTRTKPLVTSLVANYTSYLERLTAIEASLQGKVSGDEKSTASRSLYQLTRAISTHVSFVLSHYLEPDKFSINPAPTKKWLQKEIATFGNQLFVLEKQMSLLSNSTTLDDTNCEAEIPNRQGSCPRATHSMKGSPSDPSHYDAADQASKSHWEKKALIVVGVTLVILGLLAILAGLSVIPGAGPFLAAFFGCSAATAAWGLLSSGVSTWIIGTAMAIGTGVALYQAGQKETATE